MEFSITKSNFLKELGFLQGIVEKKGTIPVIQNILISTNEDNSLTLIGTDLESTLRCTCPAHVKASGKILIPARKIFDIIRNLPNAEVLIKTDEQGNAVVSCDRSRFKLLCPSPDVFPETPNIPPPQNFVQGSVLRTLISKVLFASTQEESRFALNGAQVILSEKEIKVIATDGHRLAFIEKTGFQFNLSDKQAKLLIPKKTLSEVLKLANDLEEETIGFGNDSNHIYFHIGTRLFISRMLAGQFPNFEMVMPKENDKAIIFSTEFLAGALRRVTFIADEITHAVKMSISTGKVEITAQSSESGEALEVIETEYSGESHAIAFNAQYLLEFLAAVTTEKVIFEFRNETTQIQLRPEDGQEYNYKYVVMPMRT